MNNNDIYKLLLNSLGTWIQVFDVIRVVDPTDGYKVLYTAGDEGASHSDICFDFWDRERHCENCVAQNVRFTNKALRKLEYKDNNFYTVLAKSVTFEGEDYILEVISPLALQTHPDNQQGMIDTILGSIVDKIELLESKDSFTKLYNKTYLTNLYEKQRQLSTEPMYLALWDIDSFKLINDIHGHALGDEAILHISHVLREEFSSMGIAARFGGDEFAVLFGGSNKALYEEKIHEVEALLDGYNYTKDGTTFHITVSVGLAEAGINDGFAQTIHLADQAMYKTKRQRGILGQSASNDQSTNAMGFGGVLDGSEQQISIRTADTFELIYVNKAALAAFPGEAPSYEGLTCHKYFLGSDEKCPYCPIPAMPEGATDVHTEVFNGNAYFDVYIKRCNLHGQDTYVEYVTDITSIRLAQKSYKRTLTHIRSSFPEAYGVFRLNLTKDTAEILASNSTAADSAVVHLGVAELLQTTAGLIVDEATKSDYIKTFGREHLLDIFEKGQDIISMDMIWLVDGKEEHWCRITARIMINPDTNDCEALLFGINIDKEKQA